VPRLARELTDRRVDVRPVDGLERDDLDLRRGLEDDDRVVEEREGGVPVRAGAHRVALTDELSRVHRRERATGAVVLDAALEDRELRARLKSTRGRREQRPHAGREEEERGGDRCDDRDRTAARVFARMVRGDRDDVRGRRNEAARDRGLDLGGRRDDDRGLDAREHVLHFAARLVIERIRDRHGRFTATERDEDRVTLLAEATWELTRDGRVDRVDDLAAGATREPRSTRRAVLCAERERHERTTGETREGLRERELRDDLRAKHRGREVFARLARRDDRVELLIGELTREEQRLRELLLLVGEGRRSGTTTLLLLRGFAERREHLLRRHVLAHVRGRADREREILDAGVEREEDDRAVGEKGPQLTRDLEA